jgi:hypothetical protein
MEEVTVIADQLIEALSHAADNGGGTTVGRTL